MSDKYFVDTNILMTEALVPNTTRRKALIETPWRDRSGVVSAQVLQELAVNLRKKARKPIDPSATREVIADYMTWQVVINGSESILEALEIETCYQISFWDALIVHAAHASGVEVLYSEDLADGQQYGSVRVVNRVGAR